jgi:hypothetical protein
LNILPYNPKIMLIVTGFRLTHTTIDLNLRWDLSVNQIFEDSNIFYQWWVDFGLSTSVTNI